MAQKHEPANQADWFLPAVLADGNVRESIDAALVQITRKYEFLYELRQRICSEDTNIDRITVLGRQVKELENTLRFRLSMLKPERPLAWFREAPRTDVGPFKSSLLLAPVFSNYPAAQLQTVRSSLYDLWTSAKDAPLPFAHRGESLWAVLLLFRRRFEELVILGPRFPNLRLDTLPDQLPEDFESRALRAFLVNVRNELQSIRDRLNLCFDQLWAASEKLWQYQSTTLEQQKQKEEQARTQQAGRDERRGGQRLFSDFGIGFADMEALRFMGFGSKPTKEDLRKRYIELAKQMHPDRTGGQEDSFKLLNKAYNRLLQLVK